jgi:hypothetical protein
LTKVAQSCLPRSQERWAQAPSNVRAASGHINVCFLEFLLRGSPHEGLAEDITRGFSLVGDHDPLPTGIFPAKRRAPTEELSELWRRVPHLNNRTLAHTAPSAKPEVDRAVEAKVMRELAVKTMHAREDGTPWESLQEVCVSLGVSAQEVLLVHLFGQEETRSGAWTARVIADFKANGLNGTWGAHEQYRPDQAHVFAALLAYVWALFNEPLGGVSTDWKGYYRQFGLSPGEMRLAVACFWSMSAGAPRFSAYGALPFGAAAAVNAACRCTEALRYAAARFLAIAAAGVIDDVAIGERRSTVASAFGSWRCFVDLVGVRFDAPKSSPKTVDHVDYQGVRFNLEPTQRGEPFQLEILPRRQSALLGNLREAFSSESLPAAAASKLIGKLSFTQCTRFGQFGRAMLSPLREHEYRGLARLQEATRDAIEWWIGLLDHGPPRCVFQEPAALARFILITDGDGTDRIGAALWDQRDSSVPPRFLQMDLPQSVLWRPAGASKQRICTVEGAAPTVAFATWLPLLLESLVLVFCDNEAAKFALQAGSGKSHSLRRMVGDFWHLAAHARSFPWLERVPTHLNCIDGVSRGEHPRGDARGVPVIWDAPLVPESWAEELTAGERAHVRVRRARGGPAAFRWAPHRCDG